MRRNKDLNSPLVNFTLTASENGVEKEQRAVHNVLTNTGRTWFRDLSGAAVYNVVGGQIDSPDARTSARVQYMGFGVGGKLAYDTVNYFHAQDEVVTVTALEDWVRVTETPDTWLKEVYPQPNGSAFLIDDYTIRFAVDLLETDISFAANTSKSAQAVSTLVYVAEAGLYLSTANPAVNPDTPPNTTSLVAYAIFTPILVNPNITVRAAWDFLY